VYVINVKAKSNGRAVLGVSLRPPACWIAGRISPGEWLSLSWECYLLSGRNFCEGPIPCPEESY